MPLVELLTVKDTSWFPARNTQVLVLRPDFPVPESWTRHSSTERIEPIVIAKPDGQRIEATAHISMSHINISDPEVSIDERWRIKVWFTDRAEDDVPIGSRILVTEQLRDAILPANVD